MPDEPLTVIASIRAKPGHEARVRDILVGLTGPTRREAGCLAYDLHQSIDDPARFVFYERWTGAAALDAHAASPHIQAFRAHAADLLDGPVDVVRCRCAG